ncbi:MAG: pyruvate kinase [Nitriliruptorales bacterium]|nr:pyruvate kinase [Nitriliruptorales bacterium]
MTIRILCTLGPSSLNPDVITELTELGVDLFRVNLSHTRVEQVEPTIDLIEAHSPVPICLDTEGAQIRCGDMEEGVALRVGDVVRLVVGEDLVGTRDVIPLRPEAAVRSLVEQARIQIDFDGAELEVTEPGEEVVAIVTSPGRVRSNKAVVVTPAPVLPPLSARDREALAIGRARGLRHAALSFASRPEDVELVRRLAGPDTHVIAKIESRAGLANLESIIDAAESVLIDRGDLSREVPMPYVPYEQKRVIRCANAANTPVYVATNLLETMVDHVNPTLAEANDIANTLMDGVHGLVLAAETAIGRDPVAAVRTIRTMIDVFREAFHEPRTPWSLPDQGDAGLRAV